MEHRWSLSPEHGRKVVWGSDIAPFLAARKERRLGEGERVCHYALSHLVLTATLQDRHCYYKPQ